MGAHTAAEFRSFPDGHKFDLHSVELNLLSDAIKYVENIDYSKLSPSVKTDIDELCIELIRVHSAPNKLAVHLATCNAGVIKQWDLLPDPLKKVMLSVPAAADDDLFYFFRDVYVGLPEETAATWMRLNLNRYPEFVKAAVQSIQAPAQATLRILLTDVVDKTNAGYRPIDELLLHGVDLKAIIPAYPQYRDHLRELYAGLADELDPDKYVPFQNQEEWVQDAMKLGAAETLERLGKLTQQIAREFVQYRIASAGKETALKH